MNSKIKHRNKSSNSKRPSGYFKALHRLPTKFVKDCGYIPTVLINIADFVKENIKTKEIFQTQGTPNKAFASMNQLSSGRFCRTFRHQMTVHDAIEAMKLVLVSMPEPLVPEDVCDALITASKENSAHQYGRILGKFRAKSPINFGILHFMMLLLKKVSLHTQHNLMDVRKLATIFVLDVIKPLKLDDPNDCEFLSERMQRLPYLIMVVERLIHNADIFKTARGVHLDKEPDPHKFNSKVTRTSSTMLGHQTLKTASNDRKNWGYSKLTPRATDRDCSTPKLLTMSSPAPNIAAQDGSNACPTMLSRATPHQSKLSDSQSCLLNGPNSTTMGQSGPGETNKVGSAIQQSRVPASTANLRVADDNARKTISEPNASIPYHEIESDTTSHAFTQDSPDLNQSRTIDNALKGNSLPPPGPTPSQSTMPGPNIGQLTYTNPHSHLPSLTACESKAKPVPGSNFDNLPPYIPGCRVFRPRIKSDEIEAPGEISSTRANEQNALVNTEPTDDMGYRDSSNSHTNCRLTRAHPALNLASTKCRLVKHTKPSGERQCVGTELVELITNILKPRPMVSTASARRNSFIGSNIKTANTSTSGAFAFPGTKFAAAKTKPSRIGADNNVGKDTSKLRESARMSGQGQKCRPRAESFRTGNKTTRTAKPPVKLTKSVPLTSNIERNKVPVRKKWPITSRARAGGFWIGEQQPVKCMRVGERRRANSFGLPRFGRSTRATKAVSPAPTNTPRSASLGSRRRKEAITKKNSRVKSRLDTEGISTVTLSRGAEKMEFFPGETVSPWMLEEGLTSDDTSLLVRTICNPRILSVPPTVANASPPTGRLSELAHLQYNRFPRKTKSHRSPPSTRRILYRASPQNSPGRDFLFRIIKPDKAVSETSDVRVGQIQPVLADDRISSMAKRKTHSSTKSHTSPVVVILTQGNRSASSSSSSSCQTHSPTTETRSYSERGRRKRKRSGKKKKKRNIRQETKHPDQYSGPMQYNSDTASISRKDPDHTTSTSSKTRNSGELNEDTDRPSVSQVTSEQQRSFDVTSDAAASKTEDNKHADVTEAPTLSVSENENIPRLSDEESEPISQKTCSNMELVRIAPTSVNNIKQVESKTTVKTECSQPNMTLSLNSDRQRRSSQCHWPLRPLNRTQQQTIQSLCRQKLHQWNLWQRQRRAGQVMGGLTARGSLSVTAFLVFLVSLLPLIIVSIDQNLLSSFFWHNH